MSFLWDGVQSAWQLILARDPYLLDLVKTTLQVAGFATGVAIILGMPVGLVIGLGRFRGRVLLRSVANAGLGLPPVVVGVVLVVLLIPIGPLGSLGLLYTYRGILVAQSLLCIPIMVALTSSAVGDVPPALLDQARAFGAGRLAVALLATREARIGILAAVIASLGSALSEVGAIILVGGNVVGVDQTLASAALMQVDAGEYAYGIAIGFVLLVLILLVSAVFTVLQYGGRRTSMRTLRLRPTAGVGA